MIKNEALHIPGLPYAIITADAFNNDTTARIAMQWLRDQPDIKATVMEVPETAASQILLPGLVATLPKLQRVIVRCTDSQRGVIDSYIPWAFRHKVEFATHDAVLILGVVEGRDADGNLQTRMHSIYPSDRTIL